MSKLASLLAFSFIGCATQGLAIPPALPGQELHRAENLVNEASHALVSEFLRQMSEEETIEIRDFMLAEALFTDRNGRSVMLAEDLDDNGFPLIMFGMGLADFPLANSWAFARDIRSDQGFRSDVAFKFFFARDGKGEIKISRIEEVAL